MNILHSTIILLLAGLVLSQHLILTNTPELAKLMGLTNNSIAVKSSPIGFKPIVGSLHGRLALAQPRSSCSQIQRFEDEDEDVFILADDLGCLQSIKAHHIASSGAYIGILRKNINNTLHDKEIDLVHIPILQMQPLKYDIIVNYMTKNPNKSVSALADFNPPAQTTKKSKNKKVTLQVWLSPNQKQTYDYVRELTDFVISQPDAIQFSPHFVFQAQASRKQYVGCLSSGRYCPPELEFEGQPEGVKLVSEALRQIIIAGKDVNKWLTYASYFSSRCLGLSKQNIWKQQNSELCSQNIMLSTQIDPLQIGKQFNNSFQGPRPEVDGNTYLQQQHQLYLEKKITKFPTLLLNNKQYQFEHPDLLKLRICKMYNPNSSKQTQECKKLTSSSVFTWTQTFYFAMLLTAFVLVLTVFCKRVIKRRMVGEIRSDVDNTLAQYYRYMETFDQPNPIGMSQTHPISNMDERIRKDFEDQDIELPEYQK